MDNRTSKIIPIADGINQRDSLSPILFNLVMDEIISEVKTAGKIYSLGQSAS